jgi:hypothetical protein
VKNIKPYLKNNLKGKRGGDMAQVVEHLPSKCAALSSNPTSGKKKKSVVRSPDWF